MQSIVVRTDPLVSVVTPFFNTAAYLPNCIESVLAQTYERFEYLLVNNCSTDGSRDIALRYASNDSRIRVIDNPAFVGQVENYNGALAHVSPAADYVKLVQADDYIYPECIARMVGLAEHEIGVGLVSSYWREGEQLAGAGIPTEVSRLAGRDACRRMLLEGCYFLGSPTTVLYRADLVRSRNPFYSHGRYHEDTETGFALLLQSDFGFVHEVLSFMRTDNDSIMSSERILNAPILDHLVVLELFGPLVLSVDELARRRTLSYDEYYRFLGRALLRLQGRRFWRYHQAGLATVGIRLRWRTILTQAAAEMARLSVTPHRTLERAVSDVRRRFREANRARGSNSKNV
jgi:glycosyltransferase involved in cell wall biosynthesis